MIYPPVGWRENAPQGKVLVCESCGGEVDSLCVNGADGRKWCDDCVDDDMGATGDDYDPNACPGCGGSCWRACA